MASTMPLAVTTSGTRSLSRGRGASVDTLSWTFRGRICSVWSESFVYFLVSLSKVTEAEVTLVICDRLVC